MPQFESLRIPYDLIVKHIFYRVALSNHEESDLVLEFWSPAAGETIFNPVSKKVFLTSSRDYYSNGYT